MKELDLMALASDDRTMARVLMKNKFITKPQLEEYIAFIKVHDSEGKTFLGELLVQLKEIEEEDLDSYIREYENQHIEMLETMAESGYMSKKKYEQIIETNRETGETVVALVSSLGIMTTDAFIKMFNHKYPALKLGEWLLLKRKITEEKLQEAIKIQRINAIYDFLIYKGYCSKSLLDKVQERLGFHSIT